MALVMGLAGCQTGSPVMPVPSETTATETEDRITGIPVEQDQNADSENIVGEDIAAPETVSNPAVVALLDAAEQSRASGQLAQAAQNLERALRIDPNDALVWHKLAEIRFTQADYRQALSLTARSNTLLEARNELRLANHALRVLAFEALGDYASANRERALFKF
jgi:tetratricopeptide (TPR) repeat protein